MLPLPPTETKEGISARAREKSVFDSFVRHFCRFVRSLDLCRVRSPESATERYQERWQRPRDTVNLRLFFPRMEPGASAAVSQIGAKSSSRRAAAERALVLSRSSAEPDRKEGEHHQDSCTMELWGADTGHPPPSLNTSPKT